MRTKKIEKFWIKNFYVHMEEFLESDSLEGIKQAIKKEQQELNLAFPDVIYELTGEYPEEPEKDLLSIDYMNDHIIN